MQRRRRTWFLALVVALPLITAAAWVARREVCTRNSAFVDTRAEIFPTPAEQTNRLLQIAASGVREYREAHGRVPLTLADICGWRGELCSYESPERHWVDGWGTALRYAYSGRQATLVAAGPDRVFDTPDDVRASAPPARHLAWRCT